MTAAKVRLLDVNVLVALTKQRHLHQQAAFRWLESLPPDARWATCPLTEASYLRLMMNPAVAGQEHHLDVVIQLLTALDALPGRTFLADPTSLRAPVIDTSRIFGHQQVIDFHLVNLAATSNAVLATLDRRIVEALAPQDRKYVELIPA